MEVSEEVNYELYQLPKWRICATFCQRTCRCCHKTCAKRTKEATFVGYASLAKHVTCGVKLYATNEIYADMSRFLQIHDAQIRAANTPPGSCKFTE